MGEMNQPGPAARQATRTLARQCVAAVESDEAMPHGLHRVNMGTTMAEGFDVYDAEFVEDLVAKLAQEVGLLHADLAAIDAERTNMRAALDYLRSYKGGDQHHAVAEEIACGNLNHDGTRKP